ncbi:unnamed protein product, partial [marine sediment metagenome]
MTGQIGFDEGGVLQSLSKPFFKRKVVYDQKGRVTGTEDSYNVSATHVLAIAIVLYGPQVLEWFKTGFASTGIGGALENLGTGANVEGIIDAITDSANKSKVPDDPDFVDDEFELAMRHSNLTRGEFKQLLRRTPPA